MSLVGIRKCCRKSTDLEHAECVKQGWNPKLIFSPNSNGVTDKAYYDALGKYGDGQILSTIWCNPKGPDGEAIVKRFETDYPDQWLDANAGCAFEAVQIVADAVVRANSPASPDIHSALKMTDMTPVLMYSGRIKFDATGQNINNAVTILQGQRAGRASLHREASPTQACSIRSHRLRLDEGVASAVIISLSRRARVS